MYVGSDYFIIITNVCVYRRTVEGKKSPDEKNNNYPKTHNNCVFSRERNKTNNTNFEKASKLLSNVVVRQHFCQYSI